MSHSFHVASQGDLEGTRGVYTSSNFKGEHIHPGYWNIGIAVECGGGGHQHPHEVNFHLHNVLHGFRAGRVIGVEILELNLTQDIDSMDR